MSAEKVCATLNKKIHYVMRKIEGAGGAFE